MTNTVQSKLLSNLQNDNGIASHTVAYSEHNKVTVYSVDRTTTSGFSPAHPWFLVQGLLFEQSGSLTAFGEPLVTCIGRTALLDLLPVAH